MSKALLIPADLTMVLRRAALSDYSLACEAAALAAERFMGTSRGSDLLGELRSCRAGVIAAEARLDVVGDDVEVAEAWEVSFDDPQRDVIITRVRMALDRISRGLESSEPAILEAADRIERLHALLDELEPG